MASIKDRFRRNKDEESTDEALLEQIAGYSHLVDLKPKEKIVFKSDYFSVDDDYVTTILDFFHSEELIDKFAPFWGVNLIPTDFEAKGVTTVLFEQTRRMTDDWIDKHQSQSDRLGRMSAREQSSTNTTKGKQKVRKLDADRNEIFEELQQGGVYLNVHFSLLVKAPDIDTLDWAVDQISRQYTGSNMSNIHLGVYEGEQKTSLSKLFALNRKKRNKGAFFTSQEYAGAYSLVTNGFDDPEGEYIGRMLYEYNRSDNIFDVDNYRERVVVAHSKRLRALGNAFYSDAWASKMSQAALLNNHRVVHIVLSESTKLDRLGPKFEDITRRIDMRRGEINMFEIFGDREDQLSLFSRNNEKIKLMTGQFFTGGPDTRSLALGSLTSILEEFYIEQGMWVENAPDNESDLRLTGLPHNKIPRLRLFRDYVKTRYDDSIVANKRDDQMTTVYNLLQTTYSSMLTSHGDLFDQHTTETVDSVRDGRRVIYDFSGLLHRGKAVAMAQLVNVISFAVSTLNEGDVVIIHGADNIVNSHNFEKNDLAGNEVKQFIDKEIQDLISRGGRVVYTYQSVEQMIADRKFNKLDSANYTVLGAMSPGTVIEYEKALSKNIPVQVKSVITNEDSNVCFIRRGMQNVAFELNLALGFTSDRTDMAPRELSQPISPSGQVMHGDTRGSLSTAQHVDQKWSTSAQKRADERNKKVLQRKRANKRSLTGVTTKRSSTHTKTSEETPASVGALTNTDKE